jgi:hypothetical protein
LPITRPLTRRLPGLQKKKASTNRKRKAQADAV